VKNLASLLLASTSFIVFPAIAAAQQSTAVASPPVARPHNDDDTIIVTAPFVRELDILAGKSVITGADLQREVRVQIGDSLTSLPGVSATSFTPGASRPVLRGLQGERVRVLTDGIGSIDVSNTSADHAVTIDPLTAERIEVLRGPAVLLFGSQATGGVVNVIDHRTPRELPAKDYHVDLIGGLGSAADERSLGAAIDVALGSGFVIHADGSFRKTDDLRTGGFVLSRNLRAEQVEKAEEEAAEGHLDEAAEALELAGLRGRIPNSATEQKSGGLGLSYVSDTITIGGSISRFESDYGVPSRPGGAHPEGEESGEEEEGHGEAPVSIGLKQNRYDLRAGYQFGSGFFESATLRFGAADY